MRFVLDQDVYAITARFLRDLGHDIVTAADNEASRTADDELLSIAQEQECLFMTRDRDFDGLVFVRKLGSGIIYLRILPSTLNAEKFS
jgi:predicted nuclease of predicted toxin-antitoxin system